MKELELDVWWLLAQQDLVRPVWSLDFDDIVSLLVAITALIGLFVWRKSRTESRSDSHNVEETVDDSVLGRFQELLERITRLELDLAETKISLQKALLELKELRKLEEYLQAKLHEKDAEIIKLRDEKSNNEREIRGLKAALARAEERIAHLEKACRDAGIDGEILGS